MKQSLNLKTIPESLVASVKSRFFAQYWGQEVCQTKGGRYKIDEDCFPLWDRSYLELKPLSKITDEDAEKLQYTLINVVGLDGLIRQNSIDLVKEVVSNYEKVDCLFMLPSSFSDLARELGYAIDWNNYKVSEQVELGWVQLV